MRFVPVDFSDFIVKSVSSKNSQHQNDIYLVTSENQQKEYYAKKAKDKNAALSELLSNELFRLISDEKQPLTLIAKNENNANLDWFVLSESLRSSYNIADSSDLTDYSGFATILVTAIWIHEVDLKLDNILVNHEQSKVAKIDGGCSFYSMRYPKHSHRISGSDILNRLPLPHLYPTYHWLEYISGNKDFELRYFDKPQKNSVYFENEKNRAILHICLLPDLFISSLCKILAAIEKASLENFLVSRCDEFRQSALNTPSFIKYLISPDAEIEANKFIEKLRAFRSNGRLMVEPDVSTTLLKPDYYSEFLRKFGLNIKPESKERCEVSNVSMFTPISTSHADSASACVWAESNPVVFP